MGDCLNVLPPSADDPRRDDDPIFIDHDELLRFEPHLLPQLRTLVLAEVALVAASGLAVGLLVGTGMGYLLVHVLRPLFILDPGMTFPVGKVALVAGLAVVAALASALLAAALLRRLTPTELLREP